MKSSDISGTSCLADDPMQRNRNKIYPHYKNRFICKENLQALWKMQAHLASSSTVKLQVPHQRACRLILCLYPQAQFEPLIPPSFSVMPFAITALVSAHDTLPLAPTEWQVFGNSAFRNAKKVEFCFISTSVSEWLKHMRCSKAEQSGEDIKMQKFQTLFLTSPL